MGLSDGAGQDGKWDGWSWGGRERQDLRILLKGWRDDSEDPAGKGSLELLLPADKGAES